MGSSGGGGQTTVTNQTSPEQQEAFQFRLGSAQNAINNYEGGTGYFTQPGNSPYQMTPGMTQAAQGLQNAAGNLPPDPTNNWAMNAYQPSASAYWGAAQAGPLSNSAGQVWQQGAQQLVDYMSQNPIMNDEWRAAAQYGAGMANAPIDVGSIDRSAGNIDFEATGANYDPVSVGSMDPVHVARIDPQAAIEAAQHQLSTISSPAIRNALQASGMGRSGAESEGLAQEGVRLELPIQQQVLQSEAQANQLEATIKAHQEEVQLLEEQKAKLQAQQLTATSREMAQQINGQLAGIEAQIQGHLAEAEFAGRAQAQIAQRTSALQYASNTLGQMGAMNTAQYQTAAGVGTNILGQAAGMAGQGYQGQMAAGGNILNNLTQYGLQIPNLQNQQYLTGLQGAQANLQGASLPQQMAMQNWQNQQNYILSLLGASPLPNQVQGGTQTQSQQPGYMNYLGTAALLGSMAGNWGSG